MEDGGYYAIKGFDFQVDKTINQIFASDTGIDDPIWIEYIQDLNTNDVVMQVKYKETQYFANSKIRDPVVQLLQLASAEQTKIKKYILYCHFNDKTEGRITFDEQGIREILKINIKSNSSLSHIEKAAEIKKFTLSEILHFSSVFCLEFADSYSPHFSKILELISVQNFCASPSDAIFYYAIIANYLRKQVIENDNPKERKCNRSKILNIIENGKSSLFYNSLAQYEGRKRFLQFVSTKAPKLFKNQYNYFVFGPSCTGSPAQLGEAIHAILNRFYLNATYDIKPPTFVIDDVRCKSVKRILLNLEIIINDGYEEIEFRESIFNRRHIALRKSLSNNKASDSLDCISFDARVISKNKFFQIQNFNPPPHRVLYLGQDEIAALKIYPAFLIMDLSYDEILNLVKV